MKTTALRIYGKMDLRLESFELPPCGDDGIIAEVISDSICMSSYKASKAGEDHKRVPNDCATNPPILGHEFTGRIIEVGKKWQDQFKPGDRFGIQPAMPIEGSYAAPGYSFQTIGGDSTYIRIPSIVMEHGCLLKYTGDAFFMASLSEPMSCLIGACHAQYHIPAGTYHHNMGVVEGGSCACLASAGPMGLGLIDYLVHGPRKPGLVVVTDIDDARLDRAKSILTPEDAAKNGVKLVYLNTKCENPVQALKDVNGGKGYNDVFVLAPVAPVVEQGDAILAADGCLNFFAGPTDTEFSAKFNFYNVHYGNTHVVGTSGGNTDDMKEALHYMGKGMDPAGLVTHIGGLNAVIDTTLNLPSIPGGKKLIYTHIDLPLTAISDFGTVGTPLFDQLDRICKAHNGLWNVEAETYLLNYYEKN